MKEDFEKLLGVELSEEEWRKLWTVYMYYDDMMTMREIATVWKINPLIIDDMHRRALEVKKRVDKVTRLKNEIARLEDEITKLTDGKVNLDTH